VDFRGCKDSITIDSAVYVLAPIAQFNPSQQLVCNPGNFPVNITFTDNAIHGEQPDNVSMTWEWGDGTPNTNIGNAVLDGVNNGNTSHNFATYGSYTVEQVIHNYTTGCHDSITKTINISQIAAQFTMSNDSVCRNDSLLLFNASTTWNAHPLTNWSYAMGNGQTLTSGPNPAYVYTTQGDRFDTLAQQYYNDSSLWWVISIANTGNAGADTLTGLSQNSLVIPEGVQIRIPNNPIQVYNVFNQINL
jgi:phage tail protein X